MRAILLGPSVVASALRGRLCSSGRVAFFISGHLALCGHLLAPGQDFRFVPGYGFRSESDLLREGSVSHAPVKLGCGKAGEVRHLRPLDKAAGKLDGVGMCGHIVLPLGRC